MLRSLLITRRSTNVSQIDLTCSSCGRSVPFGSIDQLEEEGITCRSCSSDADQQEVQSVAADLLRHHVAFGETPDGSAYVMMGGKKITDPQVVSQLRQLRSVFWGDQSSST